MRPLVRPPPTLEQGEVGVGGVLHHVRVAGDVGEHLQQSRPVCPQVAVDHNVHQQHGQEEPSHSQHPLEGMLRKVREQTLKTGRRYSIFQG